ncbi:MAG: chromate transporter [Acidobacteria bacterium]|nr:chromate transporter [Acidobacteriota bacterium]
MKAGAGRGGRGDSARGRPPVSFAEAFRFWVKLGFISFGGPAGQIAIMHRELVERRRWLSEERFLHALNYCMLLPGPEAQQLAIYIGWLMHRTLGGLVAGAFFVIPSIFILLALSYVYAAHGNVSAVAGVLSGFKPVVVAIVVEAVLKIGGKALKRWAHVVLAATAFVSIYFLHVPFPLIVLAAAATGLAGARYMPSTFAAPPKTKEADRKTEGEGQVTDALPLAIDDDAPPPAHTLPNRARTFKLLAAGLTFVGFMAGWNNPQGMSPAMSGVVGALVTTYVTFLPCFLFIFLGAPYIEKLRGNENLTGALTGVTAAVVGVVLNLALVFGAAVIWPRGWAGGADWFSALLSAAAFVALYRFKADVLTVVLAGGAVGLLRRLLS